MQRTLRLFLLLLLGLPLTHLHAQNVGVGTLAPHASAALDVVASDKGALLPRITEAARTGMGAPAPGLIVYQTNGSQPGFWYNAGTAALPSWVRLTGSDGVSYSPATGLQVGPGPVQGNTMQVGSLSAGTTSGLPFAGLSPDGRVVYLYLAADLAAAGLVAGPISKLELFVRTKASTAPFTSLNVKLGQTAAASVSSFPGGLTTVYAGNYSTVAGWNSIVPTTPFSWDGTSNLYLELCFDNTAGTMHDQTANYTVPYNGAYGFVDFSNATAGCALTSGDGGSPSATRVPVLRFTQGAAGSYSLPATGGTPGQVLVQQANGTAQWKDQLWQENSADIFRNSGNVGIGVATPLSRLSISPNTTEPKITLWDGGNTANHYGLGVSSTQLNYHVDGVNSNHVFWAGGKNGDGSQLMRLRGNGYLGIGSGSYNNSRLEISNDGGGSGGADDIVLRSFGTNVGPGLSLQSAHGTAAAPTNLLRDDYLGEIGFTGRANNNWLGFTSAGMYAYYKGNGNTSASELWLKTSDFPQVLLDSAGRMGLGMYPAHRLHVFGAIAANTNQGIILNAGNSPLITRGWDPFTSGSYNGLGRWGLFMEPFNLTFGVPTMAGRHFQWATYNPNSSIDNTLMTLSQNGALTVGPGNLGSRLALINDNGSATLGGGADDLVIRSFESAAVSTPGLALQFSRGTLAAPQNLLSGDVMGVIGMSGRINGNTGAGFALSGLRGTYRGDGSTQFTDLTLFTSGLDRLTLTEAGRLGVSTASPVSLLANTGVNYVGSDITGINAAGLAWGLNGVGYVASFTNLGAGTGGRNGLNVKVAGSDATTIALDVNQDAGGGAGTTLFRVRGDGNVGVGVNPQYRLHSVEPDAFGRGVYGENTFVGTLDGYGIYGRALNNPGYGYGGRFEGGYYGVRADAQATTYNGVAYGVGGYATGTTGMRYALFGQATGGSTAYGLFATASGATINWAGYFQGNVHVNGTLSKNAGSFRIDHPQDPENKYLVHSFVESPDMLNVYNGNVTTDAQGRAVVSLPAYFEAENVDFKYQLTVIGQFAQAIIGEKVRNNQFVIRTDKPGVEVSWQVTGVRNDKWAQQHRIVPEEEKKAADKGKYLNPELYGRPAAEGIFAPPAEREAETAHSGKR